MSRFIETIRFSGGRLHNIERHKRRIESALGGQPDWDTDYFLSEVAIGIPEGIYKVRIVYDQKVASVTTKPYNIRPVRSLTLVFNNDIVYDHKFEDRSELERLFARRINRDDVLIVKNGFVTDTSYANIIFLKGNEWVTPDTYLLNGTMRQTLLANGRITEQSITPEDLAAFSHFKLINAMLGADAPESEVSNIR
jgi:4-amino-4-deoxychorismate lyase